MDEISAMLPLHPKNILFVCTANICRSVFAEGIFRALLAKENLEIRTSSAGTEDYPRRQASEKIIKILLNEGIDVSAHRSQRVTHEKIEESDLIFVMESAHRQTILSIAPEAAEKIFFLAQFYSHREILPLGTEIPDPIGMDDFFYANVNDILRVCCQSVLKKLKVTLVPPFL